MAESSSNPTTLAEVDAGAVAGPIDGVPPTLTIVVGEDGVPVVDLREAPARDGALVVIDGELVLRLADGTEWPVDNFYGDPAVLQVGDAAFVAAAAVKEAVATAAAPVPVAALAAPTTDAVISTPASAPDAAAADQPADEAVEPVSGGAAFRAFEIGTIGEPLQPLLGLGPTSLGQGLGNLANDLFPDGANRPGNGSRFVNRDPIANDDFAVTSERQSIRIDVLANDRDPDPGDRVRIVNLQAEGLKGQVTLNADGTVGYDPNGQFTHLGQGEHATESFSYTIADKNGGRSTATVTVKITGVNDAPVAADDHARTTEKHKVTVDVLANDSDPDVNDVIRVVAVDTSGLKGKATVQPNGTITYDPNGQFTHLGKGEHAVETFRYTIADPFGKTSTAEVTVRIDGVNDAPVARDNFAMTNEKSPVGIAVLANDFDADANDSIRIVTIDTSGIKGKVSMNPSGSLTYDPNGKFDHLGKGEDAWEVFSYTIADQHGATSTAWVTVKIHGVNDAPVAKDDFQMTNEKSAVTIPLLANDHDPDKNDTLDIVGLDTSHIKGKVTLGPDGKAVYDPNGQFDHLGKGQDAWEVFSYTIADQHGATSTAWVTVKIHGVNDAPVAVADHFVGYETVGFFAPLATLLANDYDIDNGDTIHFAGLGGAVNGEVTLTPDGYVVFTPTPGYVGPAGFLYAIEDQHGAYDIGEVHVDIRPLTPGVIEFQTLAWFAALSDIAVVEHADGSLELAMLIEVGALTAVGVEIGGMPFFSAFLTGELLGVVNVTVDANGQAQAVGNVLGLLDLQVHQSPIFQPLGGDFYDALLLATSTPPLPAGDPGLPVLPGELDDLLALVFGALGQEGLGDGPIGAFGEGAALGNAFAFADGTFYLDIAGVLDGLVVVDGDGALPKLVAELFGQFAAAAAIDIREGIEIVADGFLDGGFQVATSGLGQGLAVGGGVGGLVSEEAALAA